MLLAETANAVDLRLPRIWGLVSCLLFDPVELLEEPERLFRRSASIRAGLEGLDKASPGMSHASDMCGAIDGAPGCVAIAYQYAAIVTEEDLRVDLTPVGLVVEKYDWLVTVLTTAVCPHVRRAGGFLVLFLQDLNARFVTMDERMRPKPQLQGLIDAVQMLLA